MVIYKKDVLTILPIKINVSKGKREYGKMKITKLFISTLLLVSISACVSLPNTPAFDLPVGSKIGYDISLSEDIGHAHYGTTVFNNFIKVQEGKNWSLNKFAKSEAQRLIQLHGYEPFEIKPDELFSELGELPKKPTDAELQGHLDRRLEKLSEEGVSAVFSLNSHRNIVATECSNFGCTEFYADTPGFYSRGLVLLPPFLHAVLPSSHSTYIVEPYVPILNLKGPYSKYNPQLKHKKGFKPANFKKMTDEEWLSVKKTLEELITETIANNIMSIRAGADGEGGYLREVR